MRWVVMLVALVFVAQARGADDAPKTSATRDGTKFEFPEASVAGGVKATIALLESCCNTSEGTAAELKAAREGDHVRLVFPKPVAVTVLGEKLAVSELVLTTPLNTGVFWLRFGDKVARCTKYEHEKTKGFTAWRNEATVAK